MHVISYFIYKRHKLEIETNIVTKIRQVMYALLIAREMRENKRSNITNEHMLETLRDIADW
jgi:hypothetical protein